MIHVALLAEFMIKHNGAIHKNRTHIFGNILVYVYKRI